MSAMCATYVHMHNINTSTEIPHSPFGKFGQRFGRPGGRLNSVEVKEPPNMPRKFGQRFDRPGGRLNRGTQAQNPIHTHNKWSAAPQ